MASTFLRVCLLFISLCCTDGYMNYVQTRCVFNSTELNDIEYIRSYCFNGLEFVRFSSSVGEFVGYTEFGVKQAEAWNNDTALLNSERAQKAIYCKHNIERWYTNILSKAVEPHARLHAETPSAGGYPSLFVCSVYDFYPKQILVYWLRDGEKVTSDVTSTDEMANGDWYYQIHSILEYTPKSGEKIQCVVEHKSLPKPLILEWDPPMPESDTSKIIVAASGLTLGLILSLAGFTLYKSKTRGWTQFPTK